MNRNLVRNIADAVLYEGYLLYPYRPSSLKNSQRWTFGGLYPESYALAHGESSSFQTEMLVTSAAEPALDVEIRFLHLLSREQDGRAWQEAVERTVSVDGTEIPKAFTFPASQQHGSCFIRQEKLDGAAEISLQRLGPDLHKVAIRVSNITEFHIETPVSRDEASMRALVSAHAVAHVGGGEFISLINPPDRFRDDAAACSNAGVWPVLAGEDGAHDCMLASPIILYDYPQVAPESAGDLFDGAEIDEILTLRIMTLTDQEKEEMRHADDRARRILERTEALSLEQLLKLHGALRSPRALEDS